jgi:hypothetical protein
MRCATGIYPNAVTYGFYHHALMQGEWPSEARLKAIDAWRRVRLRLECCTRFRQLLGIDATFDKCVSSELDALTPDRLPLMDSASISRQSQDDENLGGILGGLEAADSEVDTGLNMVNTNGAISSSRTATTSENSEQAVFFFNILI